MLTAVRTLAEEVARAAYCEMNPFCSATVTPTSGGCLSTTRVHSPVAALSDVRVEYDDVSLAAIFPLFDALETFAFVAVVCRAVSDTDDVASDDSPHGEHAVSRWIGPAGDAANCSEPTGDIDATPALPTRYRSFTKTKYTLREYELVRIQNQALSFSPFVFTRKPHRRSALVSASSTIR